MGLIETAVTQWHRFVERLTDADTPAAGHWNKYFKAGGLYIKNSAAGVFSLGGADATELTIASGAVTRTQLYHKIDTEANAASDDLDTISGGVAGQEIILRADNTGRTVVIRHNGGGTGNIRTWDGANITLDETYKMIRLVFDGTNWNVAGGTGGGSLGVAQPTPTELTIASGAITVTQGFHKIDTEADAGTDDLDTINGLVTNAKYLFRAENAGRTVVFKHGTGNIQSPTLSDVWLTDVTVGVEGWYDGTNFNLLTPSKPNDVDAWGGPPDADVNIPAQDTTGEMYSINGIYFALWQTYQLSSGASFNAIPNMHLIFDSATAFQAQINDSTTVAGMAWEIQVLTAPGAGNHTLRLGAGCTFDGVNNTASFNATSDLLEGKWISTTRFLIKTNTSVTLSST